MDRNTVDLFLEFKTYFVCQFVVKKTCIDTIEKCLFRLIQVSQIVISPSPFSSALPCDSNPCFNGASCGNAGANFICRCPPGFGGLSCEINMRKF